MVPVTVPVMPAMCRRPIPGPAPVVGPIIDRWWTSIRSVFIAGWRPVIGWRCRIYDWARDTDSDMDSRVCGRGGQSNGGCYKRASSSPRDVFHHSLLIHPPRFERIITRPVSCPSSLKICKVYVRWGARKPVAAMTLSRRTWPCGIEPYAGVDSRIFSAIDGSAPRLPSNRTTRRLIPRAATKPAGQIQPPWNGVRREDTTV